MHARMPPSGWQQAVDTRAWWVENLATAFDYGWITPGTYQPQSSLARQQHRITLIVQARGLCFFILFGMNPF